MFSSIDDLYPTGGHFRRRGRKYLSQKRTKGNRRYQTSLCTGGDHGALMTVERRPFSVRSLSSCPFPDGQGFLPWTPVRSGYVWCVCLGRWRNVFQRLWMEESSDSRLRSQVRHGSIYPSTETPVGTPCHVSDSPTVTPRSPIVGLWKT